MSTASAHLMGRLSRERENAGQNRLLRRAK